MVRKRGTLDRIEKMMSKKRPRSPTSKVSTPNPQKDRNLLNSRMLSLYKEQTAAIENQPLLENEEDPDFLSKSSIKNQSEETPKPGSSKTACKPSKSSNASEKRKASSLTLKHSSLSFKDVGGLDKLLKTLLKLFGERANHKLLTTLGVQPKKGFLLHGPPGCGKTHLARAIAGELRLPYFEVAATELVCGISGESESKIRDMFDEAVRCAPCILFIDKIDAVSPKPETTERGMEKRMVAQLLICLDELIEKDANVLVIGATNRPDCMDPALRGGGPFDPEIAIRMPDEDARLKMLQVMCQKLRLAPDFDMQWLAHHTPGYVGGDLKSLIMEAVRNGFWRSMKSYFSRDQGSKSLSDFFSPNSESNLHGELPFDSVINWSELEIPEEEHENIFFELQDFQAALQDLVPYSKREGFATVPDVTWDDVGALSEVQKELQAAILRPVKYRKLYEMLNLSSTKGILLYGPKGCGKTLLAKAIANECSINFLSVKGPELLNMYLGESEKNVRQCFQRAKTSGPCVIFFDEIDALCPKRSGSSANPAADRVVNQLLTEMDGMEDRKQVFVVGATNRLEKIDSAMLRPGRFEKIIFVDIPSPEGRIEILKSITKNKTRPKIADDVSLEQIGLDNRSKNFSGADLAYLVREATNKAVDEFVNSDKTSEEKSIELKKEHFEHAFSVVEPSITEEDKKYFRKSFVKKLADNNSEHNPPNNALSSAPCLQDQKSRKRNMVEESSHEINSFINANKEVAHALQAIASLQEKRIKLECIKHGVNFDDL